ncbi:MAG: antibiotic biosynthesis monooxygenase family protein [Desulfopila sp.]|jgi:heme-degrading monooxygenase HmoA|nr:antibiotic biosynthesis monooxygenase family protein [Desulfopila sp.]
MTVHVIIKRKIKMEDPEKLAPLLKELNERARQQDGYISSDTLQNIDNNGEFIVISKWRTAADWHAWFHSKQRRDIQGQIDSLIGERTFYELFSPIG